MDWGSFIGGGAALIAGILAFIATRQATNRQIAALARKDRLQARGIVIAVYPELLEMQVLHDRASKVIADWSSLAPRTINTITLAPAIRNATITLTPGLLENRSNFYLVQPGAASLQQVVQFTDIYNRLIETLAQQVTAQVQSFDPPSHQQALSGNLKLIHMAIDDAIREIGALHEEATSE